MSDPATLIPAARQLAQSWRDCGLRYGNEKMLDDLADALEEQITVDPVIKHNEPAGTMIQSKYTGMVLVRLRYFWVNLNDSVRRYDDILDFSEWILVHRP